MTATKTKAMTVDEFLIWAMDQPGRFELINGAPVAMSPEKVIHGETKAAIYMTLKDAIKKADRPCRVLPDGMTVRISDIQAYEPDALVYCGERLDGESIEVPAPIIIVEVLSPGTKHVDTGEKFSGYFSVASVRHYLIVDPAKRLVIHHEKDESGKITSTILKDGILKLDPPGLHIKTSTMFADPE